MTRRMGIYENVNIIKKNNSNITYTGIMTWVVGNYFGFEHYSNEMEVFLKGELCSDDWMVQYL